MQSNHDKQESPEKFGPIELSGPIKARVRPPGSKSITNRAMICAALAEGRSQLHGALYSEDTQVMLRALQQLGIHAKQAPTAPLPVAVATATGTTRLIQSASNCSITIEGCRGEIPASRADLFLANSGTSIRFLTTLCALGRGEYRLDGVPRMRQRPIADLLGALNQLGADTASEAGTGCPPVRVRASGLRGGRAEIAGNVSSQFLSGLLMAAPYAEKPVELHVCGELVSKPYVDMTLAVMRSFGVEVENDAYQQFRISPGRYQGTDYEIEPDASAASYFYAAAAVTGGTVTVEGLNRASLQGDVAFCDCLEQMGCKVEHYASVSSQRPLEQSGLPFEADGLGIPVTVTGGPLRGIEIDMNAISDTVPTLAVVALFAQGPTTIRGVAHIRAKETDRITAVATELRKLGAEVEEFDDGLRIVPKPVECYRGAEIATYDDHRMAMSFAVAGLRIPGVVILDPGCTRKTYPDFFDNFKLIRKAL